MPTVRLRVQVDVATETDICTRILSSILLMETFARLHLSSEMLSQSQPCNQATFNQ